MAQRIVYYLEVIKVHVQHPNLASPASPGAPEGLPEAIDEQPAVREAGEGVVQSLVLQTVLELPALGHVSSDRLVLDDAPLPVEDGRVGPLQPAHLALLVEDPVLDGPGRALRAQPEQPFAVVGVVLLGDVPQEALADQLFGLLPEVAAVSLVDEGEGEVRQEATDQLGLLLDNRAVALLGLPEALLGPLALRYVPGVHHVLSHPGVAQQVRAHRLQPDPGAVLVAEPVLS